EEQIPFEAQALRLLSRAADGSMRDALSLTDQAIAYSANQVTEEAVRGMLGALDQSYLIRLLDTLAAGDGQGVLGIADEMALRSLSFSTALQDLAGLLHRIAWAQFAPASVLDEWPEATDIRRFADLLSAEHVQLFYQIATIGRGEMGLAPDEYAGFTMTLLRMLAFEPAGGPGGGGGGGARVRPAVMGAPSTGTRESAPSGVAAGGSGISAAGTAKPVANSAADVASTQAAAPGSDRAKAPQSQGVVSEPSAAADGSDSTSGAVSVSASASASASHESFAASGADSAVQSVAVEPEPTAKARVMAEPDQTAAVIDTPAVSLARDIAPNDTVEGKVETLSGKPEGAEAGAADAQSASTAISAGPGSPEVIAASVDPSDPLPSATTPSSGDRSGASPDEESAAPESEADSDPASLAAAAQELVDRAAAGRAENRAENQTTPSAEKMASPRGAGGASAALDVLRSAGMRVSSDRAARAPEPVRKPVATKAAPTVQVPVPRRPAASPDRSAAPAAGDSRFNG
ncbi:MAG: DNA polymerase III subunit gamma/tau, partial [Paraburkholderia sp.]